MSQSNDRGDNPLIRMYMSSEARFYTIEDIVRMTGWSENTVQMLFNSPLFPSADYGKKKVVEVHALIEYFARKHEREREYYWRRK